MPIAVERSALVVALSLLLGCAHASTTAPPPADVPYALPDEPRCLAPRARTASADTEFETLSFLDGCWSFYDTDWGSTICGTRTADAWELELEVLGPMAAEGTGHMRVARVDGVLSLACTAPPCWELGATAGALVAIEAGHATFGTGESHKYPPERCWIAHLRGCGVTP